MTEQIKLQFPQSNVLSNSYRAQLMIEEIGYKTFYFHFQKIEDPRKEKGKRHQLMHIFILTIIGILRGFTDFENMADDLRYDEQEMTEKLGLKHGIPSHDTFSKVFRIIDSREFMHAFIDWTYSFTTLVNEHIAIDGKAIRAAAEKVESRNNPPYILNSYITGKKIVLGQLMIDRKTNEINGIPELLNLLDIKGCTITIDAIGCQRKICDLIREKQAHFVLPAKDNQKLMHEAIELYAKDMYENWKKEEKYREQVKAGGLRNQENQMPEPYHKKMDVYDEIDPKAEHGREPGERTYIVIHDAKAVDREQWQHVKAVGYTIRKRTEIKRLDGEDVSETTTEYNTWILSRKMTAREFGKLARGHWGIENTLHGVIDASFREDWCTAKKDNAVENLSQMRKICYNLMSLDPAVSGMTKKKAFNYYRRNTDAIIRLLFCEMPAADDLKI